MVNPSITHSEKKINNKKRALNTNELLTAGGKLPFKTRLIPDLHARPAVTLADNAKKPLLPHGKSGF